MSDPLKFASGLNLFYNRFDRFSIECESLPRYPYKLILTLLQWMSQNNLNNPRLINHLIQKAFQAAYLKSEQLG